MKGDTLSTDTAARVGARVAPQRSPTLLADENDVTTGEMDGLPCPQPIKTNAGILTYSVVLNMGAGLVGGTSHLEMATY